MIIFKHNIYFIIPILVPVLPFLFDLTCYLLGWDTMVPENYFIKSWGIYLMWNALVTFLLVIINWYRRKCIHIDKTNEVCSSEKNLWIVSFVIAVVVMTVGARFPYIFFGH